MRDVLIERQLERLGCRLSGRQRHRQYCIGTKLRFILSAISRDQPLVYCLLINRIMAEQYVTNRPVHMTYRGEDAFSEISRRIRISQLQRFARASARA